MKEKPKNNLFDGQEQEILGLLENYSKTLSLLEQYDNDNLNLVGEKKEQFILQENEARKVIEIIKKELIRKNQAIELFGIDANNRLNGILCSIYQTFGGQELYPSIEEKAAHLLYFIIKDHPFVDGNKRIGSFLFIYYLDKNNYLYKKNGEKKINDNALTALAILIAVIDPKEKDKLIKLITNLLSE